jgi:LysM repeat protein
MIHLKKIFSLLTPLLIAVTLVAPMMKTTPVSAQATCADPYRVERGETLTEIADTCDVTVRKLTRLNPQIGDTNVIEAGMKLDIPQNGVYTVRSGDTLGEVAARYDTTISRLLTRNPDIDDPDILYSGQTLQVPILGAVAGEDDYIVQGGDTLSEIASLYNVSLDALLLENPEITNANLIFSGQVIDLPENAAKEPAYPAYLVISPLAAAPGTTITVRGYDFAPNTSVEIGPGVSGSETVYLNNVQTNTNGNLTTSVTIPASEANPGETWVILAMDPDLGIHVQSPVIQVTQPAAGEHTYVVQPGDTLYEIAVMFNTTVNHLLDLNPQIDDPNLIYVGWVLQID